MKKIVSKLNTILAFCFSYHQCIINRGAVTHQASIWKEIFIFAEIMTTCLKVKKAKKAFQQRHNNKLLEQTFQRWRFCIQLAVTGTESTGTEALWSVSSTDYELFHVYILF